MEKQYKSVHSEYRVLVSETSQEEVSDISIFYSLRFLEVENNEFKEVLLKLSDAIFNSDVPSGLISESGVNDCIASVLLRILETGTRSDADALIFDEGLNILNKISQKYGLISASEIEYSLPLKILDNFERIPEHLQITALMYVSNSLSAGDGDIASLVSPDTMEKISILFEFHILDEDLTLCIANLMVKIAQMCDLQNDSLANSYLAAYRNVNQIEENKDAKISMFSAACRLMTRFPDEATSVYFATRIRTILYGFNSGDPGLFCATARMCSFFISRIDRVNVDDLFYDIKGVIVDYISPQSAYSSYPETLSYALGLIEAFSYRGETICKEIRNLSFNDWILRSVNHEFLNFSSLYHIAMIFTNQISFLSYLDIPDYFSSKFIELLSRLVVTMGKEQTDLIGDTVSRLLISYIQVCGREAEDFLHSIKCLDLFRSIPSPTELQTTAMLLLDESNASREEDD